jgi:phage tail sheath protein FI
VNIWQQTSNFAKQTAILAKFNDQTATHDSYSVFDSTPLYVYNKYQDNYVWIPACGHMAGLCANTDTVADAWFSPAGYNRGNLKGVTKLAYNADQAGRDALYQASINPIVSFPGQGILLFGDKTAQSKPSAFDRINVRRLFIVLEKAISTAAKYQLFELNDQFTQAMFRNMTEPFLRDIQGRRGITDFLVVCDSTNNTPGVVDANQFVADIYIKPARSINFITLNFIATRTGVSFSEIAGASNA